MLLIARYQTMVMILTLLLWLAGAALMAGYTIYVNVKLWSQIRHEPKLDNTSIIQIVQNCKSVMNVSVSIPIVVTNRINAPALFGVINPKLVLPESIIKNLSNEQIKYICLHELAHWKRKDIWLNWITAILQILHWFNLVIWYGFFRMQQDCELACDSLVLTIKRLSFYDIEISWPGSSYRKKRKFVNS